jgi:hypothetical protein
MGLGGVDANALGYDFRQRPAGANEFVVDVASAFLVAHQATVLEPAVQALHRAAVSLCRDVRIHLDSLRLQVDITDPTLDMKVTTTIVPV